MSKSIFRGVCTWVSFFALKIEKKKKKKKTQKVGGKKGGKGVLPLSLIPGLTPGS